jgi:hypothetical protein
LTTCFGIFTELRIRQSYFVNIQRIYKTKCVVRSEVITKELEISGIQDVKIKYKQNWINHLERTENSRLQNHVSATNGEEEEIVDAPGNDGNTSMPEQVKRPNPWRKMMMMHL